MSTPQNPTPVPATGPTPTANPFAGLTVQTANSEPLPPNAYLAKFKSIEPFSNEKVADKLRWTWEVASGTHKGREATALTDRRLTPHTHAGRLLAGLVGRPLVPGEDVGVLWADLQKATGRVWMVTVAPGPKGGKPSVQHVSPPPEM